MCVAAVISKYKSRIKDLAPLEDKHLLLVSATTLKIDVPDLNRRLETRSGTTSCRANHCRCPGTWAIRWRYLGIHLVKADPWRSWQRCCFSQTHLQTGLTQFNTMPSPTLISPWEKAVLWWSPADRMALREPSAADVIFWGIVPLQERWKEGRKPSDATRTCTRGWSGGVQINSKTFFFSSAARLDNSPLQARVASWCSKGYISN